MKLRSALPKQELNGLVAVHADAIGHVGKRYLVVGIVEVEESTMRKDKTREAKFTLHRLEVVGADAAPYVAEVLEQTFEIRTGKTALDLDMPDVEDTRKRYRPKGGAKAEPTLLAEPSAIEAPRLNIDPSVLSPEESEDQPDDDDTIDAEVVDDDTPMWEAAGSTSSDQEWDDAAPATAAPYAGEPAESGADEPDPIDVTGRGLTPDERLVVLGALSLDAQTPAADFAAAMTVASQEAGLELEEWVNAVLRDARDAAAE